MPSISQRYFFSDGNESIKSYENLWDIYVRLEKINKNKNDIIMNLIK